MITLQGATYVHTVPEIYVYVENNKSLNCCWIYSRVQWRQVEQILVIILDLKLQNKVIAIVIKKNINNRKGYDLQHTHMCDHCISMIKYVSIEYCH